MKTKKLFTLVLGILFSISLFSQNHKDISDLFSVDNNVTYRNDNFVSEALYLNLKANKLLEFYRSETDIINFTIPISDSDEIKMELTEFKLLTDDFLLKTSSGKTITDYKKGKFFRGKLLNKEGFATISFFENQLYGVISIKDLGNFNLGKIKNSRDQYIIYNDQKVKVDLGIECHNTEEQDKGSNRIHQGEVISRVSCVKFYLEGDYDLYVDKGTISATADYMTSLFAEVTTLYDNEMIDVEIKEMMIWDSQDSYSTTSSSIALGQFKDNNPDKDADLCHLMALGGNNTGGIAYTDILCNNSYKFGYSNIGSTYEDVPTYSWSVEVVTHETGHNFGSNHTHDCVWGPNNDEQIDDCGPESGNPGSGTCYDENNPILPNKGTIMSYCHLLGSVGIDFNLGFGQEPGDLIRSKYSAAGCLTDCESSTTCHIPVNLEVNSIGGTTATLDWEIGANGTEWEVEYGLTGFSLGSGTNVPNITNTFLNLTGLEVAKTYDWYIRTDCGGGDYSNWVGPKIFSTVCTAPNSTVLPFIEDWESDNGAMNTNGYITCNSSSNWYFTTTEQGAGRVKWGTDCNWPINGNGSLVMDRYPNGVFTTNTSVLTLDMSSYSASNDLLFKFVYQDLGDESHPEDKVWVRGNDSDSWIEAYDLDPASIANGTPVQVSMDLDQLLATGSQTVGSSFQIKLGQHDNYTAVSDGIVFDDIEIISCNTESVPYTTSFSTDIECWSVEDVDDDGYTWAINNGIACDGDYFGLEYDGGISPSIAMDDWLFTPGIYLDAGSTYEIEFTVGDIGNSEKLEVYLSDENTSTDALTGTLLFQDENILNSGCYKSTIEVSVSSSGYYYVSFHGYSDANSQHNLYIDDFSISDWAGLVGQSVESNINNTCDDYVINGVSGNVWHHIKSNGNIIASINPNNQTLGQVHVQMRDGGSVETHNINGNSVKTIPRYFNFTSDNTFASDVTIRLYFLESELVQYNNASPATSESILDLQINHYDGSNENCDWGDNSGSGTTFLQADITTGTVDLNDHFMQIDVGAFSEFLIRQDGNNSLPINYELNAYKKEEVNIISLAIYEGLDLEKMIIQKRSQSSDWETLKTVETKSKRKTNYQFKDDTPFDLTYYRIQFIDFDDLYTTSKIVSVINPINNFYLEKLFPNPSNGVFTLKMKTIKNSELNISIKNILGKEVYYEDILSTNTSSIKQLKLKHLNKGLYFITLQQGNKSIIRKLIIEK